MADKKKGKKGRGRKKKAPIEEPRQSKASQEEESLSGKELDQTKEAEKLSFEEKQSSEKKVNSEQKPEEQGKVLEEKEHKKIEKEREAPQETAWEERKEAETNEEEVRQEEEKKEISEQDSQEAHQPLPLADKEEIAEDKSIQEEASSETESKKILKKVVFNYMDHESGEHTMSKKSENKRIPISASPKHYILTGILILLLGYFFWVWGIERIYVPPGHMLVLNLKIGKPNPDPENLRVVPEGIQGIQKVVLGEGRHFYNPLFYERETQWKVYEIGIDEVGVVTSRSGKPLPPGQFLTKKLEGEKGIWERVLTPGKWRINPHAYRVEIKKIVEIMPGFVGCITAKAGKEPRENPADFLGEAFKVFEEMERAFPFQKKILNSYFQKLSKGFQKMAVVTPWLENILDGGKIKEYWNLTKQLEVEELPSTKAELQKQLDELRKTARENIQILLAKLSKLKGLDRYLFSKKLERACFLLALSIPPKLQNDMESHSNEYEKLFQAIQKKSNQKEFLQFKRKLDNTLDLAELAFRGEILSNKDEKGIQKDVLQPGIYYINPHKYRVDIVEIGYRQLPLYDVKFPSKDGFPLKLDISVVWGLRPGEVPYLIKKYGNIKDIDQKVIRPQVENICKNFGSKYEAKKFIEGATRKEFQQAFTAELERVCRERRIDILLGLVRDIQVPQAVRRPIQEGKIADLEKDMKVEQQKAQKVKNELVALQQEVVRGRRNVEVETQKIVEKIEAETKKIVAGIEADTQKEVAKIMKEVAHWRALREQILGEASAKVLEMVKTAEADKLRQNIRALGGAKAYSNYIFTQNLPNNFKVYIRYAGQGTFWTDLPRELKAIEKAAALKILEKGK
ncbi:MAG: hypothetical protein D6785_10915 [Planctomycetota bacterium]|nr:MAG: hypothetical protein D6785_10915 [Planctomycetota bacterium]